MSSVEKDRCWPSLSVHRIRVMREADLDAVLAIERAAYEFPWTAGIFRDCLRAGHLCRVMYDQWGIFAYAVMSVGAGEAHLLNICVATGRRRRGYAGELLGVMVRLAQKLGGDTLFLEVRPSNAAARRLYAALDFNEVGYRLNYYPARRGREDAIILAKHI
ncbi:MAG TPA: ribosomal-protein-alanine N-acetyltransferase [Gammaproteobacteria bacterium]|nr:ribosomal-protein-alanine N-acetyltransferase [Gammaproteobacteria bacterium]